MPLITVAISTFRETYFERVVQLLNQLKTQTFRDFMVIVVVNGNQSYFTKLSNWANQNKKSEYRLDVVFNPVDGGIAHSRNISLKSNAHIE